MILHILMFLLPLLLDGSKEVGLKVNMVNTKNFIAFRESAGQNYKTHNLPTDIRALRGPDIGKDNNLLKINFKVKIRVKTGNKYNEKIKMVNILQLARKNKKC